MKKIFYSSFCAIVLFASSSIAQDLTETPPCYTDEVFQYNIEQNPELYQQWEQQYQEQIDYINSHPYNPGQRAADKIIPVVVHVIHNGEAVGTGNNISDAQVNNAIDLLNADFARTNTDANQTPAAFASVASGTGIQFELAKIDPNGNQTTGITRTQSSLTLGTKFPNTRSTDGVKGLIRWPASKYLNIWVLKVVNPVGLASPNCCVTGAAEVPIQISNDDGVAIRHDMFGAIGTAAAPLAGFNNPRTGQPFQNYQGRTLTHEVGHYIGLFHLWGNAQSCGDDQISDTPKQAIPNSFLCPSFPSVSSCGASNAPNGDMYMNYMDYTLGHCENMFTAQQANLMNSTLNGLRSVLASPANNTATGVGAGAPSFPPVADFSSNANSIVCEGGSITYSDLSTNDPTSWLWTFSGGNPASSTMQNPTVSYPSAGSYNVTLKATNNEGNNSKTINGHVVVRSSAIKYPIDYTEGVENAATVTADWGIVNPDGASYAWSRVAGVAATGTASFKMTNFGNSKSAVDELVSPVLDLSQRLSPQLKFKVAHARKAGTSRDALKVYVSKDCGATWTLKLSKISSQMTGTTVVTTAYTPSSAVEWKEFQIGLTGFDSDAVMIKFEFTSDAGNNLYLDDINVYGDPLIGIEGFDERYGFNVFPNPTNDQSQIRFTTTSNSSVQLHVSDLLGKKVANLWSGSLGSGTHTFPITSEELGGAGIYIVSMNINGYTITKKLIIE